MDLCLCMVECWRRYGVPSLNVAAPAVICICVYAYASVAGDLENADIVVAKVSCALRWSAAGEAATDYCAGPES